MPLKLLKTSFNAGELSPLIDGRTDIAKYYSGCSQLVNATATPAGGIIKRGGSIFCAKSKMFIAWATSVAYPVGCVVDCEGVLYYCLTAHTSGDFETDFLADKWELVEEADGNSAKVKLFPFKFSVDDSHILEFGARYMRVYKNNARVFDDTTKTVSAISLPSGSNVVITTSDAHGWTTGATVKFTSVGGTTELNGKEYVIRYKDADEFYLEGTDGDDFTEFTSGGTISKVYEITTPFNTEEVFQIHKTQSADVMYISHENHHPYMLSRYGNANWTLASITFAREPFLSENTTAAYLMGFARTGGTERSGYYFPAGATGTLTASGGHTPFLESHVGSYWLIKHTRPDNTASGTSGTVGPIKVKGDFTVNATDMSGSTIDIQRKEGNGDWQSYYKTDSAIAYSSTETADNVYYQVVITGGTPKVKLTAKNQVNSGVVKITGYTSSTVLSCEVITPVLSDNSTDNAVTTSMWAEGAWSEYRGYPRTLCFYEDRLYFASTTYNPQTIWGSCVGEYLNYETGNTDSDAITLPLIADDISQIQWLAVRQSMIVGTASAEFVLSASNRDDPMTPEDKKSRPASNYGSNDLQPVILNNGLFYFQRQGRKLRVMTFAYEIDSYKSEDSTMLASHILESTPTTVTVQMIPDSILWMTREDGTLCAFTYEPGENIFAAWSRCVTGSALLTPYDYYESCAAIHGTTEDDLWVSVKRTINGETVRYIEYFSPRLIDTIDDAVCVDSAIIADTGYSAKTIIAANDNIRYGDGVYGSGTYGIA
jgi:hypothetical protein